MKKRYIASPLLIIIIAVTWNVVLRQNTPIATAEELQPYLAPSITDPRHPIDVFKVDSAHGETESEVLSRLPTNIAPEDKITFLVDPKLGLGTIVHIERAMPVTVRYGKKVYLTRTYQDTVRQVLADLHVELGDLDKINIKPEEQLRPNMEVVIIPVSRVEITKKETVPFEIIQKDDPNEYRGATKVTEKGENGERTKVFEVIREDGEEVSRKLIKNEITKKPKNRVEVHGSKDKIGRQISGRASWYKARTSIAMRDLPRGTHVKIINNANGKIYRGVVDDYVANPGVKIDLSPAIMQSLGATLGQGIIDSVTIQEILNP